MVRSSERWRALWVGLVAFAVAAAVHGVFRALETPGSRPIPLLAAHPWLVACFGVAAMLVSTVTLLRRTKGALAKLGAGALHVLLILAGLAGVLASDPSFPFGSSHLESITLPGDRGTAYLYKGGIFCDQSVWRAGPGEWWSTRDGNSDRVTCEQEGHLRWNAEHDRVHVVGSDGERLPKPRGLDGLQLNFGPH